MNQTDSKCHVVEVEPEVKIIWDSGLENSQSIFTIIPDARLHFYKKPKTQLIAFMSEFCTSKLARWLLNIIGG
jgi:hypothetical protein